jgi:hypothetical protein
MKQLFVLAGILAFSFQLPAQAKDVIKEKFYQAMASSNENLIEVELERLEKLGEAAEMAYKGALTMKKASLLEKPGNKLETFKKGKAMLEDAIAKRPDNGEFRFLRIMIQENAPSILGYGNNLAEDAAMVGDQFHQLSPEVQQAIVGYSKNSKVLHTKK